MEFERVAAAVENVPYTGRAAGRRLYDHVRASKPNRVLEIGTAHGAGSAYIAAALKANGAGALTTVDSVHAGYVAPAPTETLRAADVDDVVELVLTEDSSYTWFLKRQVEERSDEAGNCAPLYEFCFLDGAHNWTIDGLAVVLIEKLLQPNGWLLLDDLDWTYAAYEESVGHVPPSDKMHALSEVERTTPHVRAVFDLIVKQHPSFTEFREQDGEWGWARKAPGEPRRYTLEARTSPFAVLDHRLRDVRKRLRSPS